MPKATNRVLVKLRPSNALRAAESRANLRPLYDTPVMAEGFGIDAGADWYIAEMKAAPENPWDLAHSQVAGELGVAESDVIFAEPDIIHDVYIDTNEERPGEGFGAAPPACDQNIPVDDKNGKSVGPPPYPWHLRDEFSQLGRARDAVDFTGRRTRIAHLDTGYFPAHATAPKNVLAELGRNFVEDEGNANDPGRKRRLFDNSSHGTGTIGILAGGAAPDVDNIVIGGAPEADILPLRIAQSVILLRTSALAQALAYVIEQRCDVITMSMGGLPTRAWAEAVDKVYEAGICFCAAAGNHVGIVPPRVLVYPARYSRVIAVCGVMADQKPYADLQGRALEGSFGPDAAMKAALAAYTPNIPWARLGCDKSVRRNGEGTSAATPQVAAAVALWFEKWKARLPRDYQRVEAVRRALFSTAGGKHDRKHFGNGTLKAFDALAVEPVLGLPRSERSNNSFAFLRLVTGLGIDEAPPREEMYNLELAQRWMMNERLQELVPDPDAIGTLEGEPLRKFMEAVIEDGEASMVLRRQFAMRYPVAAGGKPAPATPASKAVVPPPSAACDVQPDLRPPAHRRIRVYAVDPSLSARLATAATNELALEVRWETLEPGPIGEYLAIDDHEFEPVDLDAPELLAQDGWAPAEGNPQFHQQMVYAVAMKTIGHFEKALGRPVLWRHLPNPENPYDDSRYVQRLPILPHALRQANAFYSPTQVALLFGWFEASANDPGQHMPGSRVYAALSHDIIAHETTHAILDGMYRRFNEPTNPDVLAFHEGFADIVSLMQHFTIPQVLESEIAKTRGNLEEESFLGMLAVQFGQAMGGGRSALRNAIGRFENGVWTRITPDPAQLQKTLSPHARGAILVAAVFDAFLAIYKMRSADLLRIYTGGTGVLPNGAIHPDLVRRLADEAAKSASHVLTMCIRALDYLPPVDITFFEYLRALITADFDLAAGERFNYRVAFVEAFRRRGIYPHDIGEPGKDTPRTMSVDTLRWQGDLDLSRLPETDRAKIREIVESLKKYADIATYTENREALFDTTRKQRQELHAQLKKAFAEVPTFASQLGVDMEAPDASFEVHELRRVMHVTPDGRYIPHLIVILTQSKKLEELADSGKDHLFRGGSTLVVDLSVPKVKYRIVKNINSESRRRRTVEFIRHAKSDPLRAIFFAPDADEPFAMLHALGEAGS